MEAKCWSKPFAPEVEEYISSGDNTPPYELGEEWGAVQLTSVITSVLEGEHKDPDISADLQDKISQFDDWGETSLPLFTKKARQEVIEASRHNKAGSHLSHCLVSANYILAKALTGAHDTLDSLRAMADNEPPRLSPEQYRLMQSRVALNALEDAHYRRTQGDRYYEKDHITWRTINEGALAEADTLIVLLELAKNLSHTNQTSVTAVPAFGPYERSLRSRNNTDFIMQAGNQVIGIQTKSGLSQGEYDEKRILTVHTSDDFCSRTRTKKRPQYTVGMSGNIAARMALTWNEKDIEALAQEGRIDDEKYENISATILDILRSTDVERNDPFIQKNIKALQRNVAQKLSIEPHIRKSTFFKK